MTLKQLNTKVQKPEQLALDFFSVISETKSKPEVKSVSIVEKHSALPSNLISNKTSFPPFELKRIKVRYSQRAKRMSLSVAHNGQVELIAPGKKYRKPSLKRLRDFAIANKAWIKATAEKYRKTVKINDTKLRPTELMLAFIGQKIEIDYQAYLNGKKKRMVQTGNRLTLAQELNNEEIAVTLGKWLAQKAKECVLPELSRLSQHCELPYQKASMRGQKSRWGSCSSKGNISLNYCILFLPPEQGLYVLIHELCHLKEFNHSKRFWSLVGSFEPNYKRLDKEIDLAWQNLPAWLDQRFVKDQTAENIVYLDI